MTLRERLEQIKAATEGHTPGPWSEPYYDCIPGDEGWWVHNGLVGSEEYAVGMAFPLNPKSEQDAKLIASAPDLLTLATKAIEENERLREVLTKVRTILDMELGDTDPHIYQGWTEKEVEDNEPLYYAMILLTKANRSKPKQKGTHRGRTQGG